MLRGGEPARSRLQFARFVWPPIEEKKKKTKKTFRVFYLPFGACTILWGRDGVLGSPGRGVASRECVRLVAAGLEGPCLGSG